MTEIVNNTEILVFYIGSLLLLTCQLIFGKRLIERMMSDHIADNHDSTAQVYFKMTHQEKWNFMGHIYSFINPFVLVAFAVISTCSCDAPLVNDTPQTYFTNDGCFTSATVWHYRSLALFIAYCTVDTVNCVVL